MRPQEAGSKETVRWRGGRKEKETRGSDNKGWINENAIKQGKGKDDKRERKRRVRAGLVPGVWWDVELMRSWRSTPSPAAASLPPIAPRPSLSHLAAPWQPIWLQSYSTSGAGQKSHFHPGAFKWLRRLYSLFLCLTENLSGPSWPGLASSGSLLRLLLRNRLDSLEKVLHFIQNGTSQPVQLFGPRLTEVRTGCKWLLKAENWIEIHLQTPVNTMLCSMIHAINGS